MMNLFAFSYSAILDFSY